jgi:hypothetical protein
MDKAPALETLVADLQGYQVDRRNALLDYLAALPQDYYGLGATEGRWYVLTCVLRLLVRRIGATRCSELRTSGALLDNIAHFCSD